MGKLAPGRFHTEASMAKKAAKPKPVESEEEPDIRDAHDRRMPTSKSDAVRMAIAAGFDGPQVGAGYIQSQFGLDVSPEHFSAVKSADKKKVLTEVPKSKPRRKSKAEVEGYLAPPPKPQGDGEADLLAAMEAMKPLVEQLGAEKVKRIVDLLG
jgi:hypothetical protein